MVTMIPSESSSRSLVRMDLAENIHHDDLDGALGLGLFSSDSSSSCDGGYGV
jgi:hypothetical protein